MHTGKTFSAISSKRRQTVKVISDTGMSVPKLGKLGFFLGGGGRNLSERNLGERGPGEKPRKIGIPEIAANATNFKN